MYEDENCIHLDSNGDDIETVWVRYWSYPVDDEGHPKIPEHYTDAIMNYVLWRQSQVKGDPLNRIQQFKHDWVVEKTKQKGLDAMPNVPEARELVDNWMSLIPRMSDVKFNLH